MTAEHVGCLVDIDCGPVLGFYQGKICRVDPQKQTITLERVFWNGTQHSDSFVVLSAGDMVDLKILKLSHEFSKPLMVAAPRATTSRVHRPIATSGAQLIRNQQKTNDQTRYTNRTRTFSPRKPVAANFGSSRTTRMSRFEPCGIPQLDGLYQKQITDGNQHLGAVLDRNLMDTDFDFEGNLALFDKEKGFPSRKDHSDSDKRSVVRKYRHDQNIIEDPSSVYSWVSKLKIMGALIAESTERPVPLISAEQKANLFLSSLSYIDDDTFVASNLASRILECYLREKDKLFKSITSNNKSLAVICVGTSSLSATTARYLCFHLVNRHFRVVLLPVGQFSSPIVVPTQLKDVSIARAAAFLPPPTSVQLVINISNFPFSDSDVDDGPPIEWLNDCINGHLLSVDCCWPNLDLNQQTVLFCYLPHKSSDLLPNRIYGCDLGLPVDALGIDLEFVFEKHLLVKFVRK